MASPTARWRLVVAMGWNVDVAYESERFIGRTETLAELRARHERAIAGAGSFVLIRGEAGVGKTRLVEHAFSPDPASGSAASSRPLVLWGRTRETGAPVLWPFLRS